MELAKNFDHAAAESRWYSHWMSRGYFNSTPDARPPYTIVMPPPNVTGVLHMGHALNNTVQDVLIRRAKALGYNTCWVPGTDHASIATEAKVVGMLRERGIDKNTLSRDEFLVLCLGMEGEVRRHYPGATEAPWLCAGLGQRTHFTMDEEYYKAVIRVFVELYKKGHIYRGVKMINWDPKAKTALSDEEVIHKPRRASCTTYSIFCAIRKVTKPVAASPSLPFVRKPFLGDTAVCVHPDDERYKHSERCLLLCAAGQPPGADHF